MPSLDLHLESTLGETMRAVEKVLADHPDTELDRVSLTFSLRHDLQATEQAGGSVAVAVGPAQVGLNYTQGRTQETDANLVIQIDVGRKGLSLAPPPLYPEPTPSSPGGP